MDAVVRARPAMEMAVVQGKDFERGDGVSKGVVEQTV